MRPPGFDLQGHRGARGLLISSFLPGDFPPAHVPLWAVGIAFGFCALVGVVFGIKVRGLIAWFMWRGYYWSRTPGINRKVRVAIDWLLTAIFGTDPVQLKVEDRTSPMGSSGSRRPPEREEA